MKYTLYYYYVYIYIYTDNVFLYWKYILLYWKYCYIYTVAFHNTCSFLNFTCVNAVMPLQIIIADKRFVTLVTFVRLFPGVSKHMTGEFSRSFKSFITIILGTFVWFFFLVNTTVYPLKKKIQININFLLIKHMVQAPVMFWWSVRCSNYWATWTEIEQNKMTSLPQRTRIIKCFITPFLVTRIWLFLRMR